jgi:hypothetical protein
MVDSDDFLPAGSTQKLVDAAVQYNSDFVRGGFWRCRSDGHKLKKGGRYPEKLLSDGSFFKNRELWFFDQHTTYLYNSNLIQKAGAKYDENMSNGEDVAFLLQLMPYMEHVTLIPETVYCYRKNPTSSMLGRKSKQYYLNLFKLYDMEYSQLAAIGFREQVDYFLSYHLGVILPKVVFPSIPDNLSDREAIEVLTSLKNIITELEIEKLCFSPAYSWQKQVRIPLLSKQVVLFLAAGHVAEAYAAIKEYVKTAQKNKEQRKVLSAQKRKIQSLQHSTSWRITKPLRILFSVLK